ncbi:MAG: LacI family DNA-binding transcriptional regulator [Planctomycetota bacterium]
MPSLRDVAKVAGVSTTTVSLVINGRAKEIGIADATVARVQEAVKQLGYRPSYHGRSSIRGRSDTIGFVIDFGLANQIEGLLWTTILRGAAIESRRLERDILLVSDGYGPELVERAIHYVQEKRLDAVIIPGFMEPALQQLRSWEEQPVVFLLPTEESKALGARVDFQPAVQALGKHLNDMGHKRVLVLGSTARADSQARSQQFLKGLKEARLQVATADIDVDPYDCGDIVDSAAAIMAAKIEPVLKEHDKQTAVVCYNDLLACGVMAAARNLGKQIPEDLSVIGCDNLLTSYMMPSLTTIDQDFVGIGRLAATQAVARSLGEELRNYKPPARLHIGTSSGHAP